MEKKEDLRVIKTKKSIYEGLLFLMKDKSFEEIKVSDICKVSLTNRSTFYDHFNDKYELLACLIKDLEIELTEKLEKNNDFQTEKEYYMKMIELLFDHISENSSIYSSIIKNNTNSIASDMFRNTLLKDVEKHLKSRGKKTGNIPLEIITLFYVSAVINVCVYYISDPLKYTKEDILDYLKDLVPDQIY